MTFEQVWLLLLVVPPTVWMIRNSYRSSRTHPLLINTFGTLMLLVFCLPGTIFRVSSPATGMFTRAWPAYRKRIRGLDARVLDARVKTA
jgi:hypothetical protein